MSTAMLPPGATFDCLDLSSCSDPGIQVVGTAVSVELATSRWMDLGNGNSAIYRGSHTHLSHSVSPASDKVLKGHRGPKSKTGCVPCKSRRIKCDETRPRCDQCRKKDLECVFVPPKVPGRSRGLTVTMRAHDVNRVTRDLSPDSTSARSLSVASPIVKGLEDKVHERATPTEIRLHPNGSEADTRNQNIKQSPRTHTIGTLSTMGTDRQDEEKILTNIFFNTSTHLFSIYTGSCNPFMRLRQYIPDSKALHLAVQAMAALSLAGHESEDNSMSMDHGLEIQRQAYRELAYALNDPETSLSDSTFAAILHIGMTEPWHSLRSDQSGAMHLRTSKVLICQRHHRNASLPPLYLCNLLLYWDLLVSLHSDSSHEGYSTGMLLQRQHSDEQPIDYIDPTVGVAQVLFHDIIELEHFLRHWRTQNLGVQRYADPQDIETARFIEHRLRTWQPNLDSPKLLGCLQVFETTSLHDILFTAEAYRQAALLLLNRSFPALARSEVDAGRASLGLREAASSVLQLLSAIPVSSPVCTTHEWILFVTAPDVSSATERAFIHERMSGLLEKIGVIGIKEALEYIESTWKTIDLGGPSSAWMDEMHKRNWLPLLG